MTEQLSLLLDPPASAPSAEAAPSGNNPLVFTDDMTPESLHELWNNYVEQMDALSSELHPRAEALEAELKITQSKQRKSEIKAELAKIQNTINQAQAERYGQYEDAQIQLSERIAAQCEAAGLDEHESDNALIDVQESVFGIHQQSFEFWTTKLGDIIAQSIAWIKTQRETEHAETQPNP